jgi:hypothetical protein
MDSDLYNIVDKILVPHTAMELAVSRITQCVRAARGSAVPIGIAILGESRAGKTRCLEHVESNYPSTRCDEGLRMPILRVRVPSNPSVKGLAEALLQKLEDQRPDKGTETNMTQRLIKLLNGAEVRMLMLDEFQHFYDRQSHKVMHHVADWLKLVVDESRVALVVSGLETCQSVLNQNEQLAGRFLAPVRMPRFRWECPELREEFIAIMDAFKDGLSRFDIPDLSDVDMAFRFYCASGGLIGYIAKILRQAIWNALDAKRMTITLEDLAIAHKEAVYSDEKSAELPDAFARDFMVQPNLALLQRVDQIGLAQPEEIRRRGTNRKPNAGSPHNIFTN